MKIAPEARIRLEAHERWHIPITIPIVWRSLGVWATVASTQFGSWFTSTRQEPPGPSNGLHEVVPRPLVATTYWAHESGRERDRQFNRYSWEMHIPVDKNTSALHFFCSVWNSNSLKTPNHCCFMIFCSTQPGWRPTPPLGKKSTWPIGNGRPRIPPSVWMTSTNAASEGLSRCFFVWKLYSGSAGSKPVNGDGEKYVWLVEMEYKGEEAKWDEVKLAHKIHFHPENRFDSLADSSGLGLAKDEGRTRYERAKSVSLQIVQMEINKRFMAYEVQ